MTAQTKTGTGPPCLYIPETQPKKRIRRLQPTALGKERTMAIPNRGILFRKTTMMKPFRLSVAMILLATLKRKDCDD